MGYTTTFKGRFELDKPLKPEHQAYLDAFSSTRHMTWRVDEIAKIPDPIRDAAELPLGEQGEYFVAMAEAAYSLAEDPNHSPKSQPSLYCQWMPSNDGKGIEWDEAAKFQSYDEWLWYVIEHFLKPWGYTLDGSVAYQGEDREDYGLLVVKDNLVDIVELDEPPFPGYFDE